jgi:hypothetical protein
MDRRGSYTSIQYFSGFVVFVVHDKSLLWCRPRCFCTLFLSKVHDTVLAETHTNNALSPALTRVIMRFKAACANWIRQWKTIVWWYVFLETSLLPDLQPSTCLHSSCHLVDGFTVANFHVRCGFWALAAQMKLDSNRCHSMSSEKASRTKSKPGIPPTL